MIIEDDSGRDINMHDPDREQRKTPKVYNKYHGNAPEDAVYIGRGSKWGNPYSQFNSKYKNVIKVPDRATAIAKFREYLQQHPELIEAAKKELVGKDLVCYCKPYACHGDVLLEIANEE